MRHQNMRNYFSRGATHRRATLRNMVTSLFLHERIETTKVRARALRPYAERLITLGKRGDLHARRLAARDLFGAEALTKLFGELAERYKDRPGGYTRILKLGRRRGDNAEVAFIELVDAKLRQRVSEEGGEAVAKKAGKAKSKAPVADEGAVDADAEPKAKATKKASAKKASAAKPAKKKAASAKASKASADKPKAGKAKSSKPASKAKSGRSKGE